MVMKYLVIEYLAQTNWTKVSTNSQVSCLDLFLELYFDVISVNLFFLYAVDAKKKLPS